MKFFKTKALLLSLLALGQFTKADDIRYQASSIENGVILHAHTWTFNTIKSKLADIKKAGYTAIQTSPITKCIDKNKDKSAKYWYWTYQPLNYDIGNYFLGTEEEFKSLCSAARNMGLKIVVDVVLNHLTSDEKAVQYPFTQKGWLHTLDYKEALNEGCRNEITQMELLGLKDVNTSNKAVQDYTINFLKRVLDDGASGFRFDAAKHIELPDDHMVGSNYWERILNNNAEFQYGEALQTNVSREKDYGKIMKLTASGYGFTLREAVTHNDFSIGRIASYNITVPSDNLITWVESHDNYSNDSKESVNVTSEEITLAWSLLAARKDSTPLFFPRPRGGGGKNPQFPAGTRIGEEGDPLYKSKAITEINIFHNSMEGEMENLRNINNEKILMIERGNRGAVIINLNNNDVDITSDTLLVDGSYADHISGNVFTVSNGKITGKVLKRSATVLYNSVSSSSDPFISVKGYPTVSDNEFVEQYIDINLIAKNLKKATYSINGGEEIEFESGKTIRIGEGMVSGKTNVYLSGISENDQPVSAYYTFTKVDTTKNINIYYQCERNVGFKNCDFIYAYVYCYDKNSKPIDIVSNWPGNKMQLTNKNNLFKMELPARFNSAAHGISDQCYVFFTQNESKKVNNKERIIKAPFRDEGYTLIDKAIYGHWNYYGQYDLLYEDRKPMTTTIELPFTTTKPSTTTTTTTVPVQITTTTTTSTIVITSTIVTSTTTTTTTTIQQTPTSSPYDTVYFEKPNNWNGNNIKAYTYYNSGSVTRENVKWPGESMTTDPENPNIYIFKVKKELNLNRIIFNDGRNQVPSSGKQGFEIKNLALYNINGYVKQYRDDCTQTTVPPPPPATTTIQSPIPTINTNIVTIYYYSGWNPAYIHYQFGSNAWTVAPGVAMKPHKNGYQTITIDIGTARSITFVCNDGHGNWDNNNGRNYNINSPGNYILKNGQVSAGLV